MSDRVNCFATETLAPRPLEVCEVIQVAEGRLDLHGRPLLGELTLEKPPSNMGLPIGIEFVRSFGFVNGRERSTRQEGTVRKNKKPTGIFRVQDHFG